MHPECTRRNSYEYSPGNIPQTDGNNTIVSDEHSSKLTEREIYERDPELLYSAYTVVEDEEEPKDTVALNHADHAPAEKQAGPSHFVRNHTFTLNREKQTANLAQDSAIGDFEITVNDNDANVNIKCSSGFYATVARPAMSSFLQGTNFAVGSVQMNCFHVAYNRDQTGVEESRVLHINLDASLLKAKVTISLHHTTRLLQIQGGAEMPGGTKGATWFLESYLKQKFDYQAKLMKYDITQFNKSITDRFSSRPKGPSSL